MFRPQIQKTNVIFFTAVFSILMVQMALKNVTYHEKVGLGEKIKSAKIMNEALSTLKKEVKLL